MGAALPKIEGTNIEDLVYVTEEPMFLITTNHPNMFGDFRLTEKPPSHERGIPVPVGTIFRGHHVHQAVSIDHNSVEIFFTNAEGKMVNMHRFFSIYGFEVRKREVPFPPETTSHVTLPKQLIGRLSSEGRAQLKLKPIEPRVLDALRTALVKAYKIEVPEHH